jgi:hypothetical protein
MIKNKSHIETFIGDQKKEIRKNLRMEIKGNIKKIKISDFAEVFSILSPEENKLSFNFKGIKDALSYTAGILAVLVFGYLLYMSFEIVNIKEIAKTTTLTQDEFNAMYDILISELLNDALITLVISFLATPAAGIAAQIVSIRKFYKLQKASSKFASFIKLRSKMYKLLESKPCRFVLSIRSAGAESEVAFMLGFGSPHRVSDSLRKIRRKLGIKIKRASFNNLLIKKLANFLEKNNLTEELRILKKEIL